MLELTKPYEPDGPLCAQLRGVVDAEILRRALQSVASACARDEGSAIILDLHEVDSRCTLTDVNCIGEELTRLGFQASWRLAVVGSKLTADFAYFETICRSRGLTVRLFKNQDAARHWLVDGD